MKKYVLFSAIVHTILLFLSISYLPEKNTSNTETKMLGNKEATKVEIIDPPKDDSSEDSLLNEDDGEDKSKKGKDCDLFFGGIGIQQDYLSLKIESVYKGYPADRAGIMIGDVVESETGEDIRGEIGTSIRLKVTRGNLVFSVSLIREKICYEDI